MQLHEVNIKTYTSLQGQLDFLIKGSTIFLGLLGFLLTLLGFFGFSEIKKIQDARKEYEDMKDTLSKNQVDVRALEAVIRVIPKIILCDHVVDDLTERKRYAEEALWEINEAETIGEIENSAPLLLEKGKALKRLGKFVDALIVAKRAAKLANEKKNKYDEARAYYNASCYMSLMGGEIDDILKCLDKAISISPRFKNLAKNDTDFSSSIKENQAFQSLIRRKT